MTLPDRIYQPDDCLHHGSHSTGSIDSKCKAEYGPEWYYSGGNNVGCGLFNLGFSPVCQHSGHSADPAVCCSTGNGHDGKTCDPKFLNMQGDDCRQHMIMGCMDSSTPNGLKDTNRCKTWCVLRPEDCQRTMELAAEQKSQNQLMMVVVFVIIIAAIVLAARWFMTQSDNSELDSSPEPAEDNLNSLE